MGQRGHKPDASTYNALPEDADDPDIATWILRTWAAVRLRGFLDGRSCGSKTTPQLAISKRLPSEVQVTKVAFPHKRVPNFFSQELPSMGCPPWGEFPHGPFFRVHTSGPTDWQCLFADVIKLGAPFGGCWF